MSRNKHALIIGADPDIGGELRALFEGLDFEVTSVEDASAVREVGDHDGFEVAVINVSLPDTSWRRTLRTLKDSAASTTVMLMMRSPDEQEIRHALGAGTYVALDRPISEDQLNGLIECPNDGMFVALRG